MRVLFQSLKDYTKKACMAFVTVDIEWADKNHPSLRLTNTKHTYYEITCACGYVTRKAPYRSNSHGILSDITCSQWRMVGPGLPSLMICLAYRSSELIENILGQAYYGWLMSEGYKVYRKHQNRGRCWAHLIRKAKGLKEGLAKEAPLFREQILKLMGILLTAIREAREHPPDTPLTQTYQAQLSAKM